MIKPYQNAMRQKRIVAALLLAFGASLSFGQTDLSNSPLSSASNTAIKPNIMFILDDSGSMDSDFLPDGVDNNDGSNCFKNYLYNRIYFNPNYTYTPPVKSDGTSFPDASFTAAPNNGFDSGSSTRNLNSKFKAYSGDTEQQAYYYELTGSGVSAGSCGGNSKYTKRTISSSSTMAQNFANWYSYYRKRLYAMRTAVSQAFSPLTSKYRVGFSTISSTDVAEGSLFLDIRDFTQTQKDSFYTKLFTANQEGWTPLRGALAKAGQYYGKKAPNQTYDPLQYSCQQNFTILSTDGYWNTNDETTTYGPFKLNGTSVGNTDASPTARPMLDDWKSGGSWGQTGGAGKSDTLADVAMYYYANDLRTSALGTCTGSTGNDVCENNVPGAGNDVAVHQHMTTFTLGLGVDGKLAYDESYETQTSGDFFNIKQGSSPWPNPINNSGAERIDDLWHAAVNGRGHYYSAKDPASLVSGLSKALAGVSARTGSSAAAATSNLEPVAGDNFVYVALYRTQKWDGDLKAYTIDPDTGVLSTTAQWSAQSALDTQVANANSGDGRNIYFFTSGTSSKLSNFTKANLTSASKNSLFETVCTTPKSLSQCADLTTAQIDLLTSDVVINYIRGNSGYEDQAGNTNRLLRDREHLLGDIVNAVPVYVKKPPFAYTDDGYAAFVTANASRAGTVYVAANDGMLHAIDSSNGQERWAFIPSMVMANLYKLGDKNYATNHLYYVDGSPSIGDIKISGTWKTILVGGLNKGGRGYYALDVTDPSSPKALWEFTNNNLGYSFGNPIITKLVDGTWVVIFSSGYNNVSPGDGNGHLFIVDAATGTLLSDIPTYTSGTTGAGNTTTPSGLGKINAWVDTTTDNTVQRVYGGDLLGNVWRFDVNDTLGSSGKEAMLLAQAEITSGTIIAPVVTGQPITTKPELGQIRRSGINYNLVFVGTGRYLGETDLNNTAQQSIYAFKDDLSSSGLGDLRSRGDMVQQTFTAGTNADGAAIRTTSTNTVDWATKAGWYVDLNPSNASPGERVNVDMQLQYNILTVAANVPNSNACNIGGYAWLYNLDIATGSKLSTASEAGMRLSGNALVAGIKVVKLTNGKTVTIVTDTGGGILPVSNPSPSGDAAGTARRTSWRELVD